MIKNYLKIALRNIRRYSAHSILNVSGMAVGMACAILILLWIYDEWSYDRNSYNAGDVYRIIGEMGSNDGQRTLTAVTMEPIPHLEDLIISGYSSFNAFGKGAIVTAVSVRCPSLEPISPIMRYTSPAL
ncbi:MAG TPA: ABC transporter permease [Bacteroidales bacterium]|nr:ABC transporter permease [Bacteroidales bacterium]